MDDAALLAEIVANPDDDAPRLVYADLLVERGDPRGELIHVQCTWSRTGYTPELQARERALLKAHGEAWKDAAGIRGALASFHRGFPFSLVGTCTTLLASREALRTQPITTLSVMGDFERLDELMALPELARIRSLSIAPVLGPGGGPLPVPAAHLVHAARSPHLGGVRALEMDRGALDDDGARVLADAAWLAGVEKLAIGSNPVGPTGIAALAPRLAAVRRLALARCHVGGAGLVALAAAPTRALDFAWLADTRADDAGVEALAASPVLASVTRLDLGDNYLHDAAAIALADSPHVGALRALVLAKGAIGPAGAAALARSTQLAQLVELDLTYNALGPDGVDALARGTGLPSLRRLAVTHNRLYTGEVEVIDSGEYQATHPVEETAAQIAARFRDRPGLVIT